MLWALAFVLGAEPSGCLSREAVSARVAPLVSADQRLSTAWSVEQQGDRARILWLDASGRVLNERWITGSGSCARLEQAAAVVIAAWLASSPRFEPVVAPVVADTAGVSLPAPSTAGSVAPAPSAAAKPSPTSKPSAASKPSAGSKRSTDPTTALSPTTAERQTAASPSGQPTAAQSPTAESSPSTQPTAANPIAANPTAANPIAANPSAASEPTEASKLNAAQSPTAAGATGAQAGALETSATPPPTAALAPPQSSGAPAPTAATEPPTSTTLVERTVPRQPGPSVDLEVGLDARGSWSDSIAPGLALRLDVGRTLGGFLELAASTERRAALGNGSVHWQRTGLSLGGRYRKTWGRWFLEPAISAEASLLFVRGSGFQTTRSTLDFDAAGCVRLHGGVRAYGPLGILLGARGCVFAFDSAVGVTGVDATYPLPRAEAGVVAGFFWALSPVQGSEAARP